MEIAHPLDKITALLQRFHQLTGIWCCLTDVGGTPLLLPGAGAHFCTRMQKSADGRARCLSCMREDALRANRSREMFRTARCHAGVMQTTVPIYHRGEWVANVIFSSLPIRHSPEHAWKIARMDMSGLVAPDGLHKPFLRIRQLSPADIAACAEMLHTGITAIYAESDPHAATCGVEQQLENYINSNYFEKLTLDGIAKALSVSKTKLCSVTAMHGNTVMSLVNERRIEEAKRLLRTTDLYIYEVSQKVGVPDHNYFSKLFRAAVGETPREYQKRYRGEEQQEIAN